ncbi:hypothetical protein BJ138DRAFT_1107231 [Hygrophoropsis aurantiaca]|uniref:Uncharacterized protein n=1 Tax=Hygrophoropsis aurantiaca TaxID=72124 RepID=A0ACB7ZSW9_9AGAM|nr:hypothetical protein BJ138DRAFT_1107231 [Hygrophoropsis aurantiaca]
MVPQTESFDNCRSSRFMADEGSEPPFTKLARTLSVDKVGSFTTSFGWSQWNKSPDSQVHHRLVRDYAPYDRPIQDSEAKPLRPKPASTASNVNNPHSNNSPTSHFPSRLLSKLFVVLLCVIVCGYAFHYPSTFYPSLVSWRIHPSFKNNHADRIAYLEKTVASAAEANSDDHAARIAYLEQTVTLLLEANAHDREGHLAYLEQAIQQALLRYSKDFVGRQDYALRRAGGEIIPELTAPRLIDQEPWTASIVSSRKPKVVRNGPEVVLDEDLHTGSCWRFGANSGQVGISLSERISITHVTIDHIAKELTSTIELAPRTIILWGVVDGGTLLTEVALKSATGKAAELLASTKGPAISTGFQFAPLAWITYDIHTNSHVQTFQVFDYITSSNMTFSMVVVEIVDNWGAPSTCLYRVRVHGQHST